MPNTSKANKASNSSKEDRISALPDDVIHHVLGFLQAAEAVHTSVLARRWRYLWKSMRCLRVNSIGRWEEGNGASLSNFMNCLLLLRDPGSTLDEVEIKYDNLEDETKWISIWIRHALSCQAQLIFRRDLRWCPTFSKLKTLLLNKWCVQINLHALVCMLEHSPVLENLILQLRKQEETALALEVEGNNSLMHKPAAISGCLKIIKVKFDEIDDRVCKVLKFLSILGTEIIIQRTTDCWRY
ncbi:F-box protein At5g03100 isoform X2 [Lolium perenne]|uniref:F-box protein At5g03100 isoform X2 n=1 Tax=Lolium perenne TaxID=4522 RepID=UPI0021F52A66|nr:F-box protein At5g03100-like isoform X2 [Lolium perenne]